MSLSAELGSTASTLDGVIERITTLADGLLGSPDDDIGTALIEIERQLTSARRRLDRVRRDLDG